MERTQEIRNAEAAYEKETENLICVTSQVSAGHMHPINLHKAKAEHRKARERLEEVTKGTIFSLP